MRNTLYMQVLNRLGMRALLYSCNDGCDAKEASLYFQHTTNPSKNSTTSSDPDLSSYLVLHPTYPSVLISHKSIQPLFTSHLINIPCTTNADR
jgi:hypothetical protein